MLVITIEAKAVYSESEWKKVRDAYGEGNAQLIGRIISSMGELYGNNPNSRWFEFSKLGQCDAISFTDAISEVKWNVGFREVDRTYHASAWLEFCIVPRLRSDWPNKDSFFNHAMREIINVTGNHGAEIVRVIERTPDVVVYQKDLPK